MTRSIIAVQTLIVLCLVFVAGPTELAGQTDPGKSGSAPGHNKDEEPVIETIPSQMRIEGTLQYLDKSVAVTVDLQAQFGSPVFVATAISDDSTDSFTIHWEAAEFSNSRIIPSSVDADSSLFTGPMGVLNEPITASTMQLDFSELQLNGSVAGTLEYQTLLNRTIQGQLSGSITEIQ